jgi:RimJ/RimL family protein N-acetyltransferase
VNDETWPTGYSCAPGLQVVRGNLRLRPIHWRDREPIREWRNAQINILRQAEPLSAEAQDLYYRQVIEPQMLQTSPDQILVALEDEGDLIGYGGIVHINWPDLRGEVSFLSPPARSSGDQLRADWLAFLELLTEVARRVLGFHKLTTETYEIRRELIETLEHAGFLSEGVLKSHHRIGDQWVDSHAHGLLL